MISLGIPSGPGALPSASLATAVSYCELWRSCFVVAAGLLGRVWARSVYGSGAWGSSQGGGGSGSGVTLFSSSAKNSWTFSLTISGSLVGPWGVCTMSRFGRVPDL